MTENLKIQIALIEVDQYKMSSKDINVNSKIVFMKKS